MALRQSRGKPVLALLVLLLGACAPSSREIPEAGRFATDLGYYRGPAAMRVPGREAALPGRYVILAFSGGQISASISAWRRPARVSPDRLTGALGAGVEMRDRSSVTLTGDDPE